MPVRHLAGRVAVVTGGARGIGLAIAQELVRRGAHVALVDVDPAVDGAAAGLAASGTRVTAHRCDVADRAAMLRLPAEIVAQHGAVHVLVNNAGVSLAGRFLDASLEDLDWIVAINFWGVVHGCKAFLPVLLAQDEGHIINVSSSFGLLGFAGKTGYSATKAAVRGFSEALRAELLGSPVGVTVLYPGPVATELIDRGRAVDEQQRTAEARFVADRAVPAARVGRKAVAALRRGPARVMISIDYRLIDWLVRTSPSLAQAVTARIARRMPF